MSTVQPLRNNITKSPDCEKPWPQLFSRAELNYESPSSSSSLLGWESATPAQHIAHSNGKTYKRGEPPASKQLTPTRTGGTPPPPAFAAERIRPSAEKLQPASSQPPLSTVETGENNYYNRVLLLVLLAATLSIKPEIFDCDSLVLIG